MPQPKHYGNTGRIILNLGKKKLPTFSLYKCKTMIYCHKGSKQCIIILICSINQIESQLVLFESVYTLYKVLYSSYTNGNKSFKIPTDSLLTVLILQNNMVQNQSRLLYW